VYLNNFANTSTSTSSGSTSSTCTSNKFEVMINILFL